MSSLLEYFNIRPVSAWDVLDILIIWFVIYNLFRFLRGSRTLQMAMGLFALFAGQILAEKFDLMVTSKSIGSLFNIIPIAIIVLFQDEIRRLLASIGSRPFFSRSAQVRSPVLDGVFQAALRLSKAGIGMLVIFEEEQGLRRYIESGTRIDALPSTELIIDIFQPKSNLHDGAVIVSDSRLASAACLMPLSNNRNLPKIYGTRHRAAIGITEESDCVSLVVSEETGNISFAQEGRMFSIKEKNISQMYEMYNSLRLSDDQEKMESLKGLAKVSRSMGHFRKGAKKGRASTKGK